MEYLGSFLQLTSSLPTCLAHGSLGQPLLLRDLAFIFNAQRMTSSLSATANEASCLLLENSMPPGCGSAEVEFRLDSHRSAVREHEEGRGQSNTTFLDSECHTCATLPQWLYWVRVSFPCLFSTPFAFLKKLFICGWEGGLVHRPPRVGHGCSRRHHWSDYGC